MKKKSVNEAPRDRLLDAVKEDDNAEINRLLTLGYWSLNASNLAFIKSFELYEKIKKNHPTRRS